MQGLPVRRLLGCTLAALLSAGLLGPPAAAPASATGPAGRSQPTAQAGISAGTAPVDTATGTLSARTAPQATTTGIVPAGTVPALAPAAVGEALVAPPVAAPAVATPAATEIVPGTVNRSSISMVATYAVDARLAVAARSLRGSVTITARNASGADVDRVLLNTTMGPLGRLALGAVTVDGRTAVATRADQTITVRLGGVLPAGATAVIAVPFSATLRSTTSGSTWLLTRANGITSLYRWVPWISRATAFARPNFGDPFVTPVSSRVTLRFRTDVRTTVVVNGTRTSISADGRTSTWTLDHVRDVVVNAAVDYRTTHRAAGNTDVRVSTRPGQPSAAILRAAVSALTRLEARLGPYPWPVLRIVQSSGGYGMEGPGIVWIPAGVPGRNLPYLLAHEIAHQWFYGLVGNDQAREPFADEAAADMVARFVTGSRRASRCSTGVLDRSIYRYTSACYYERIYIQGGNLLDDARRRMGTSTYFAAIRRYLAAHRWGLVHTRTLLDALDAATPLHLAAGWRSRFPRLY